MSVVSIFGDDAEAEARALSKVAAWRNQQAAQPMREADRLLQTILEAGDLVGRDAAGRMVIQLALEPRDFHRLMAFGADAVEAEDDGEDEPYQCSPMSPCWFWDGGATFFGRPTDQVLDLLPPKRLGRVAQIARAVALGLLLAPLPLEARADQAAVVAPLPMSTAQAPQQCCRMCKKGKPYLLLSSIGDQPQPRSAAPDAERARDGRNARAAGKSGGRASGDVRIPDRRVGADYEEAPRSPRAWLGRFGFASSSSSHPRPSSASRFFVAAARISLSFSAASSSRSASASCFSRCWRCWDMARA
jgi:hypothetical protein